MRITRATRPVNVLHVEIMKKIISIIFIMFFSSYAGDQLPPQREISETLRGSFGRLYVYFHGTMYLVDDPLLGFSAHGKGHVHFLNWDKGKFNMSPLSLDYFAKENDTVIDNTLMLKGTDIKCRVISITMLGYDSIRNYYAEFSSGISTKSLLTRLVWVEIDLYGYFSTDKVINPIMRIGLGLQASDRNSIIVYYNGNYKDLSFTKYSDTPLGSRYLQNKLGINEYIAFSRWIGLTLGLSYTIHKTVHYPSVSIGIRVINWFHLPFEKFGSHS